MSAVFVFSPHGFISAVDMTGINPVVSTQQDFFASIKCGRSKYENIGRHHSKLPHNSRWL